jgi:hypothetical protein
MYVGRMLNVRFNHFWSERQADTLELLKEQTGLTKSEIIRRMFDYCCSAEVLNTLVPAMSGHLRVEGK